MIPVNCMVNHNVKKGTYGDCVRACVASVLEKRAEDVPHFFHDDPDASIAVERMRQYLATLGYAPFQAWYDGNTPIEDMLKNQAILNPNIYLILFGSTSNGNNHCVIIKNGEVVHDPAWYKLIMNKPNDQGFWGILVIAKL